MKKRISLALLAAASLAVPSVSLADEAAPAPGVSPSISSSPFALSSSQITAPTDSPSEPPSTEETPDHSFSLAAIAIVDGQEISSCAGITLNPNWILSAAHCFDEDLTNDAYTVFTSARSGVEEVHQIPGADLAVARLAGDRPDVGCTPLPDSSPQVGKTAEVYVFRNYGGVAALPFTIKANDHLADNPAAGVGVHPMLSLVPQADGSLTRGGDSGAGVFVADVDGRKTVVGIVAGLSQTSNVILAEDLARYSNDIEQIAGIC